MQIHEYYRYEGIYDKKFLEGRWHWSIDGMEIIDNKNSTTNHFELQYVRTPIQWTDLFGKQPDIEFVIQGMIEVSQIFPLTQHFILIRYTEYNSRGYAVHNHNILRVAELNWSSGKLLLGDVEPHQKETGDNCEVSIDQNTSSHHNNSKLYFLLYEREQNVDEGRVICLYFCLIVKERRIQQIGTTFYLQSNEFNCLNLCDGIVRGLSSSLEKFNQFDLHTQQMLPTIQLVHKLPLSSSSINLSIYAYVNNCIYVTQTKLENKSESEEEPNSFIVVFRLETGTVTMLKHVFKGHILHLSTGPNDGHLYVNTKRRHHWVSALPRKICTGWDYPGYIMLYQFFRLPIKQPESLFFLSAAATATLTRPLPTIVENLIKQRDDVPTQFFTFSNEPFPQTKTT